MMAACGGDGSGMSKALVAVPPMAADSIPAAQIDWSRLDSVMGRAGAMQAGDVYRFGMPRGDMNVSVDGVRISPPLALGSWIAFKAVPGGAIAMGDLVLRDSEVAPVISRLQEGGVEQTAIHHHLVRETPRVLYVHVHAHGDPVRIAATLREALALTATPARSAAPAMGAPTASRVDSAGISSILGHDGKYSGAVYQVNVPRAETIMSGGFSIPSSMGLGTVMNFQATGAGKAAITGDFILLGAEVNPVIRTLRANGIEVTSLHNHLLDDEPRFFFMHFWANDDAMKLARGLRAALDSTNSHRPGS
jgi:hypothetical protein